jgi:hypothetical protein
MKRLILVFVFSPFPLFLSAQNDNPDVNLFNQSTGNQLIVQGSLNNMTGNAPQINYSIDNNVQNSVLLENNVNPPDNQLVINQVKNPVNNNSGNTVNIQRQSGVGKVSGGSGGGGTKMKKQSNAKTFFYKLGKSFRKAFQPKRPKRYHTSRCGNWRGRL